MLERPGFVTTEPPVGPQGTLDAPQGPSLWTSKPWWCQPWSIVATGLVAMAGSWIVMHRWWITVPVSLAVVLWWAVFLVLVPRAYLEGGPSGV